MDIAAGKRYQNARSDKPSQTALYCRPSATAHHDIGMRQRKSRQKVLDIWKPFGYGNRMVTNSRRQRDAVFRAISDPTRREILGILRSGQQTVGGIAGNFRMSRPAISKHLRLLHAAGLVVTERRGTASVCSLDAKPLRIIDDWLHDYEMFWSESLRSLKKHLEENQ